VRDGPVSSCLGGLSMMPPLWAGLLASSSLTPLQIAVICLSGAAIGIPISATPTSRCAALQSRGGLSRGASITRARDARGNDSGVVHPRRPAGIPRRLSGLVINISASFRDLPPGISWPSFSSTTRPSARRVNAPVPAAARAPVSFRLPFVVSGNDHPPVSNETSCSWLEPLRTPTGARSARPRKVLRSCMKGDMLDACESCASFDHRVLVAWARYARMLPAGARPSVRRDDAPRNGSWRR